MHAIASFFSHIKYLAIGGLVTSAAEFIFGYNLFDLAKDGLNKLLSGKKA